MHFLIAVTVNNDKYSAECSFNFVIYKPIIVSNIRKCLKVDIETIKLFGNKQRVFSPKVCI